MIISFVIPTIAARESLFALLNTLNNFSVPNSEILVVLQTSKRNNPHIIKKLQNHEGIKLIINQGTKSSGSNRNVGATLATGQFLCFIDDDIFLDKSFLSAIENFSPNPNMIYFPEIKNTESVPFPLGDHVGGRSFVSACFIISKTTFLSCGLFNEKLNIYREDSEFFIRAKRKGMILHILENAYVWHPVRYVNGNTLKSFFTKNMLEPLFHKLTSGNYEGVLKQHVFSTLPNKYGVSVVTYFIALSATIFWLLVLTGQVWIISILIFIYLVFAVLPTFIYIRKPTFFNSHLKLRSIPSITIYLVILPEIFLARLLGSIIYRHFAV